MAKKSLPLKNVDDLPLGETGETVTQEEFKTAKDLFFKFSTDFIDHQPSLHEEQVWRNELGILREYSGYLSWNTMVWGSNKINPKLIRDCFSKGL